MTTIKKVWAVIGAEGLKGTFSTMDAGIKATQAANGGDTFVFTVKEKGLKNIEFDHTERSYVIKHTTEEEAAAYIKGEQYGIASFKHEYTMLEDMEKQRLKDKLFAIIHEIRRQLSDNGISRYDLLQLVENAYETMLFISRKSNTYVGASMEELREALGHKESIFADIERMRQEKKAIEEEAARVERARIAERDRVLSFAIPQATDHGFKVNTSAVLAEHFVSEEEDEEIIESQLDDAPLFQFSASTVYRKRASVMYNLTKGAEVIEAQAIEKCDYHSHFDRQLGIVIRGLRETMEESDFDRFTSFWYNDSVIRQGIMFNSIDHRVMENFSIRSPKFSKHLIKTFGEKSTIVKLFNDRPKAEEIGKDTAFPVEGKKLVVSNLAANVMKMTADNEFSSCQDYTYEGSDDLDYLQRLPSSIHDETMSIAYIIDEEDDYKAPCMAARVLISPLEYHGQLFFIGFNLYGAGRNETMLKASIKNLYGDRFLFADDIYSSTKMHEHVHVYDYHLQVNWDNDVDVDCCTCGGSGSVTAEIVDNGHRFDTECPICEGSGKDDDYSRSWGDTPYVNNGLFVRYGHNLKRTKADETLLISILAAEHNIQEVVLQTA